MRPGILARTVGLTLLLAAAEPAAAARAAAGPRVDGEYETPFGKVRLKGAAGTFTGTMVTPAPGCDLPAGAKLLEATLLDDSLAGKVRVCGKGCPDDTWARGVLLVGKDQLSGALHVPAGCAAPVGKNGGVTFRRAGRAESAFLPRRPPAKARTKSRTGAPLYVVAAPPPTEPAALSDVAPVAAVVSEREKARALMRDGAAFLNEGYFERARGRFLEAIDVDPRIPEAYNGVGVTYRMRNDLARALDWYKQSLAVDPDFGDAYYNMACVYALQGEKEMALRYLQIAALNGYQTAEGIDTDPDLEPLHAEPAYQALMQQKM